MTKTKAKTTRGAERPVIVTTAHRGERHRSSRFREADVVEMRRRAAAGESLRSVARSYGTYPANVSRIVKREAWSHVA